MTDACCEKTKGTGAVIGEAPFELARIEKTRNVCGLCENYARQNAAKPVAVLCCDGACLRGEVARRAANILCHELAPEKTARICLGGAFTKNTGQRGLVRNASRLIALEGCFIDCASRMMRGVVESLRPEVIRVDGLYECDESLFGINEMDDARITRLARAAAGRIAEIL